jgi:hypothetical protein
MVAVVEQVACLAVDLVPRVLKVFGKMELLQGAQVK